MDMLRSGSVGTSASTTAPVHDNVVAFRLCYDMSHGCCLPLEDVSYPTMRDSPAVAVRCGQQQDGDLCAHVLLMTTSSCKHIHGAYKRVHRVNLAMFGTPEVTQARHQRRERRQRARHALHVRR